MWYVAIEMGASVDDVVQFIQIVSSGIGLCIFLLSAVVPIHNPHSHWMDCMLEK